MRGFERVRFGLLCTVHILKLASYDSIVMASTISPSVDGCNNYTVLSEADRAQGYPGHIASIFRNDTDDLVPGWYRFQGAAGDRMADKCVHTHRCSALYPGWLNGTHPTVSEGVVTRTVCYRGRFEYFHRSYNCCDWSNNIRVRNCGAFFVYELQKPPRWGSRYCGNGSLVDGCKNYTVLSEADRAQEHIELNVSNYRCDTDDLVPGWFRFQGAAGDRMADKCVPMKHCGTHVPLWLSGAHPTTAESVVTRKVCFSWLNSCCHYFGNIRIKNCGVYFVYEVPILNYCYARLCGNGRAVYSCPALTVPSNGIKFGCPKNATMYNDTVCRFSCNDGYIGSGSQARRCQHNGTWSGQDFICRDIDECAEGDAKCSKEAYCVNLPGTYNCNCKEGFSGDGFNCVASGTSSTVTIFCDVVMLVAVGLLKFMM